MAEEEYRPEMPSDDDMTLDVLEYVVEKLPAKYDDVTDGLVEDVKRLIAEKETLLLDVEAMASRYWQRCDN
jgi:hypothetical protein